MNLIKAGDYKCPCNACIALGEDRPGITEELTKRLNVIQGVLALPITITSGYRCKAHNEAVGGAPDSQHMLGQAVDILCRDADLRFTIVDYATTAGIRFIEICPNHVHVDMRDGPKRIILGAG